MSISYIDIKQIKLGGEKINNDDDERRFLSEIDRETPEEGSVKPEGGVKHVSQRFNTSISV